MSYLRPPQATKSLKVIVRTHRYTHTYLTDGSTWTTKLVDKYVDGELRQAPQV